MIIDSHNHLGGPDKGDGKSQSEDEILASMDKAGVEMAVVFPFNVEEPGISFSTANDYIAAAVGRHPDRLTGFCRLDPNYGDKAVSELVRCVKYLGLKGIKLHPSSQDFPLDHPALLAVLSVAEDLGVPALFDTGKKASPPMEVARLASRFPKLTVIMAHMNLYEETVEAARTTPNIYIGTTGYFNVNRLGSAIRELGANRFLAGSDSPYIRMQREIEKFEGLNGLEEWERRAILGGNFGRIIAV